MKDGGGERRGQGTCHGTYLGLASPLMFALQGEIQNSGSQNPSALHVKPKRKTCVPSPVPSP